MQSSIFYRTNVLLKDQEKNVSFSWFQHLIFNLLSQCQICWECLHFQFEQHINCMDTTYGNYADVFFNFKQHKTKKSGNSLTTNILYLNIKLSTVKGLGL